MKSHIIATTLLGSVGIASAAEYPAMIMDTWCITYLSTYLVPISDQPAPSPSRHLTFFGNSSTATASYTDDQSIIASEPGTTFGLTTLDISPTQEQTDSEAPSFGTMTGSLTDTINTPSPSATDITSSALPTSTGIVEPPGRSVIFLVQASSNQERDMKKRDIGGFVGADNPDVCTFALSFNLAQGQLFVNGLPTSYTGEDYKALGVQDEDTFVQGSITKTFGTTGRTLFFRNSGLPNGEAGFCQDASGQVYITFTASPPGCVPVTLGVYDVTQCQNGRLVGFETSTSALAISTEASTAETVTSGVFSSGEPTAAETTVPTEDSSISSFEPSGTFSESSGSEAFTTTSSQNVDTSAFASSPIFGSVSSTVSSQIDETSTPASSSVSSTRAFSTISSQAITSSDSTSDFGTSAIVSTQIIDTTAPDSSQTQTQTFGIITSTIVSSELVESSVTTQSLTSSDDLSTEASSSTEQEVTSLLTTTSDEPTDTTSETLFSTSETSTEPASSSTFSSTEEITSDLSTTVSESTTEIASTTTEASTADTTTDLTTTTTTAAPPTECENTSNPYTVSGVDFNISCDSVVTGGTSVGTAPSSSFNQCVSFCVAFNSCVAIQYERATGSCTGFSAVGGTAANSAFDVAARV